MKAAARGGTIARESRAAIFRLCRPSTAHWRSHAIASGRRRRPTNRPPMPADRSATASHPGAARPAETAATGDGPARCPPRSSMAAGRAGQRATREGSTRKCRSGEANTAAPAAPIASEASVPCHRSSHFSSHSIFLVAVRNAAVAAAHSWIVRNATNNATAPNTKQAFQA